ncbi:MAG TPA: hypothetical protein VJ719_14240 [Chthoniobacterales bacterium]|nr:hypothetical protein [Chthoniobacterales bacterium]
MLAAIDNWLFLILVAVAALFRLLSKAVESKNRDDAPDESTFAPPGQSIPRQPRSPSSEEEQIRKFLEALGQPRGGHVPPPVAPRTDVAPRPVAPVQPPASAMPVPGWPKPPAERRRVTTPRQTRQGIPPPLPVQPIEVTVRPAPAAEAPAFEIQETVSLPAPAPAPAPAKGQRRATAVPQKSDLDIGSIHQSNLAFVRLLRTPGGLRQAVILREILGKPRGLQSIDEMPGVA